MAVLVASILRPRGRTGVQTHTAHLAAALEGAGVRCEVVTPSSASPMWQLVFAVRPLLLHRLNKNWSTRWYRYWHARAVKSALGRAVRREPGATVIAQEPLTALAALDLRRRLALPCRVVLVCHFYVSQAFEFHEKGELDDERYIRGIVALEDRVLREVDLVVYVSHWAKQAVERHHGFEPANSCVIWNGIGDVEEAGQVTRPELGLGADDFVLTNVGRLEPVKNQLGLLDLFAEVRASEENARLVLIGDGPQRAEVKRRVLELGLDSDVLVLGTRSDVPSLLALADLYVHYAKVESLGMALLEAARAGLPVAAVPAGGVREVLDALGSRLMLDAHDPKSSGRLISSLARDPDRRRQLGERARRGYETSFSQEAMARRFLALLAHDPRNA